MGIKINYFQQLLIKAITQRGYTVGRPTSKERVCSLIRKLHPQPIAQRLIRLGPRGDGGYLIPDDLEGLHACFSPGVDTMSGFEQDCLNHGMNVFMADRSVDKPTWNISPDQYDFIKKHIGCTTNAGFITMDDWVNSSGILKDKDLLLQMDIEGGEYFSLINMSDALLMRFRIVVIEFHSLHDFWNPHFFSLAEVVFDKILQTHTCVHIHPNNCCGIDNQYGIKIPRIAEFTFLRNERVNYETKPLQFPHALDYDNIHNESIVLPENWYRAPGTKFERQ